MKGVLVAIGIAAVAIGAAMFLRDGRDTTPSKVPNINVRASAAGGFAPETVLQIRPQAASASKPAEASRRSALATEMALPKSWKAIYDRLKSTPEGQTPEGLHYLATILSACANVTDRKTPRRPNPGSDEARAKFMASVSEKDPNRKARLAAFETTNGTDRCADLRDITTTEAEIKSLREQAAAAGDPKARAQQLANEIWATVKPSSGPGAGNLPTITDAQLESLQQLARTGDPAAMVTVASVLASTMGDMYIRAGPNEQPVDARTFYDAWQLASCEFGASCGQDNRMVSYGCAFEGRCGVDNLRDYYFFHGHSPAQSQTVGEYSAEIVRAIRTGDWSYFQFVRGPPPNPGSVSRFGSGP
ncbi:hypothetical protein DSM104443_03345 [Usitatibacter rugosus]|uniref:Uncharacterized protein n=1 Tax=Usitatibacter rugosus TaxID=2732067 RepID=A0A6M4GY99_9PROT|nr:hypothetical protein [Usitatibacter rugosus]QJR12260.1 hypothetical protein DSM104443_03345 [Usitatibacter rugosus]